MEKKEEKTLYTPAQLGFLVLAALVGIGAEIIALCVLVVSDPEPTTFNQVLSTIEIILGFVLILTAMHYLHDDLKRRWVK